MTLFIVPQLPVKNRYQEHWMSWWSEELHNLGVDYYIIRPDNWLEYIDKTKYFTPNDCEYFAPTEPAVKWDAEIAKKLFEMMQFIGGTRDYLLFLDFDYTGLFQGLIPLIKRYNPDLRIGAYVHAGSWAPRDYFEPVRYSKLWMELGTTIALDHLFFPSESAYMTAVDSMCELHYFKTKCIRELNFKSHVVGSLWKPYDEIMGARKKKEELIRKEKWLKESNVVMINGRYGSLDHKILSQIIENLRGEVTFVATDKWVAKKYNIKHMNYFEALSIAKVMLQPKVYDTFGLAVVEALYTLTVPVLPRIWVYEELYGKHVVRQNNYVDVVEYAVSNYDKIYENLNGDYLLLKKEKLNAPRRIVEILGFI